MHIDTDTWAGMRCHAWALCYDACPFVPVMPQVIMLHVEILPHKVRPGDGIQSAEVQATLCTLSLVLIKRQRPDQADLQSWHARLLRCG